LRHVLYGTSLVFAFMLSAAMVTKLAPRIEAPSVPSLARVIWPSVTPENAMIGDLSWERFGRLRLLHQSGLCEPMDRSLRRFWHPFTVSRELDRGEATSLRVMGEDLPLYRGASGGPISSAGAAPIASRARLAGSKAGP